MFHILDDRPRIPKVISRSVVRKYCSRARADRWSVTVTSSLPTVTDDSIRRWINGSESNRLIARISELIDGNSLLHGAVYRRAKQQACLMNAKGSL